MDVALLKEITARDPSEIITDTAAHKPTPGFTFGPLFCIDATVFDTAMTLLCNVRNIANQAYPSGSFVWGRFSTVKLVSGRVQAFETDK